MSGQDVSLSQVLDTRFMVKDFIQFEVFDPVTVHHVLFVFNVCYDISRFEIAPSTNLCIVVDSALM